MKLIVRPQFYLDLEEEIYWLLKNAGPEVAQRWRDAVWQTIIFLKANPEIGRQRTDLKQPGVRSWRVPHFTRWLIFYGVRADSLVIYRIRSGLMNLVVLKMES
jgi:plasmid stabilization system protein ParE